ncbi:MAG: N-formylglutamate amidohydrolase [Alphaproteobacteria bacterium]|nr:N-formylglutamate amidohydrolase [Alphaproteobacteria bacterium]
MDTDARLFDPPIDVQQPARATSPLVVSSPHSGSRYPERFVAESRLDLLSLRRSEDAFVDELFGAAPALGAPLLRALFPRAYLDVNREPFELDPAMFHGQLPTYANTTSPRVRSGLGTVPRVVANGAEIYDVKLPFTEAEGRIDALYRPFHDSLAHLVGAAQARFGYAVVIDCHSMPSVGGPMDQDAGAGRADMVLGDRHGTSCSRGLAVTAARILRDQGFRVALNVPYAGGYITQHYGRPREGVQALQIEVNRAIYMDEAKIQRLAAFADVGARLGAFLGALDAAVRAFAAAAE